MPSWYSLAPVLPESRFRRLIRASAESFFHLHAAGASAEALTFFGHLATERAGGGAGNRVFLAGREAERRAQVAQLRDVFGNPFRPVYVALSWLTPDVRSLAKAAYDERLLPQGHLDPLRLAVLADALEEAGCVDGDVLGHLRSPGPHVRGCHVVDVVLGRQ